MNESMVLFKGRSSIKQYCPMKPIKRGYKLWVRADKCNMGGVDKADMLCSLYGMDRKSRKWWQRLFFGIIDRMLVNSYVVHNKLEDKAIPLLLFRRLVAQHLLTAATPPQIGRPLATSRCNTPPNPPKRRKTDLSVSADIRLTARGVHWPIFDEKRGRCEVCSQNKIESRPHSKCSTCKSTFAAKQISNAFLHFMK